MMIFYSVLFFSSFSLTDVYIDQSAVGGKNCGSFEKRCQTLTEALPNLGVVDNNFIISPGVYSFPYSSYNMTGNQSTSFTGESSETAIITFTLSGPASAWRMAGYSQVTFTRITFIFDYEDGFYRNFVQISEYPYPTGFISQCRFTQANTTRFIGVDIMFVSAGKLTVSRCVFENFALNDCHTFQLFGNAHLVSEYNAFNNISASADAIYSIDGLVVSYQVYEIGAQIQIQRCNFFNITGNGWGGAIYTYAEHILDVTDTTFNGCRTTNLGGGAIFLDENTPYAIVGCIFQNNSAPAGGAIYINQGNVGAHRFLMNEFRMNKVDEGGLGVDIYQAVDVIETEWFRNNFEHFKDNCGTCTTNCFVSGAPPAFDAGTIYHGCAKKVALSGHPDDNVQNCERPVSNTDTGLCGTIEYIVGLDEHYPRLSIGNTGGAFNMLITVRPIGVQITRELAIIGAGVESAQVLVGPFANPGAQYGFSVRNGTELSLYQMVLKFIADSNTPGIENPHFVEVQGTSGVGVSSTITISGCIIMGQDDRGTSAEGVIPSVFGAFSETFYGGTTRVVDTIAANISFASTYGGLFRVFGGNLLLRALTAVSIGTTAGSGAVVFGSLNAGNSFVVDEGTLFRNNSAPLGSGGAVWLNLSVGSQVYFTSALFLDNSASREGAAVYIHLPVSEVESLIFGIDVIFRGNQIITNLSAQTIENNVHLTFPTRVAFTCFSSLFYLSYLPFNLTLWTVIEESPNNSSNINGSAGSNPPRSIADILALCGRDRCSILGTELCGSDISPQCTITNGICETNPCVDRVGYALSPPCSERCIVSFANASRCTLDTCEAYPTDQCIDHAEEGCSVSKQHCMKRQTNVTSSSLLDQISLAIGITATTGTVRIAEGRFLQTPFSIGRKTLIVVGSGIAPNTGGDGSAAGVGTTVVAARVYNGGEIASPMLTITPFASVDLIDLTLSTLLADSNSPYASRWVSSGNPLVLVTEARLALYNVSVRGLTDLDYSVVAARRPIEFVVLRTWFTDITITGEFNITGGAALAVDLIGSRNGLAAVSSSNFTNISCNFGLYANDPVYSGGALHVRSLGIGHHVLVEDCVFDQCRNTVDGGGVLVFSEDESLVAVLEDLVFINCSARNGGGLMGTGKPLFLHHCSFRNCIAGAQGGAFYQLRGTGDTYIVDSEFTNCSCGATFDFFITSGGGGAISVTTSGAVFIHGSLFDLCCISDLTPFEEFMGMFDTTYNGSAVIVSGSRTCIVSVSNFTNCAYTTNAGGGNRAQFGGLSIQDSLGEDTLIDRCRFETCTSRDGGGAINLMNSNVTIRLCSFQSNKANFTAEAKGGAWYVSSASSLLPYIGGNNFSQNTQAAALSGQPGQDIYVEVSLPVVGSRVEKNCFSSYALNIAVGTGDGESNAFTSETCGSIEPMSVISASDAQQVQSFMRYNLAETLTINLTTNATSVANAYNLSSAFILTEEVTIQSALESNKPYIVADNTVGNLFTISTGKFTLRNVFVWISRVAPQSSIIRSIEKGTVTLQGVSFIQIPPPPRPFSFHSHNSPSKSQSSSHANSNSNSLTHSDFNSLTHSNSHSRSQFQSHSQSNQDAMAWIIAGDLLTFEQGTVTVTDCSFANFTLLGDGHIVSVRAEHHHASSLVIKNSNFTNIRSLFGQHVGICIFAELRNNVNDLTLENLRFDHDMSTIAIIIPTISLLSEVLTVTSLTFVDNTDGNNDTRGGTRVYIGTFLTAEERPNQNDICTNKSLGNLVNNIFGEGNTGLCVGEADACDFGIPTQVYQELNCLDSSGRGEENGDGGKSKAKSKVNGGVVAAIVVSVIAVVVIIVAVVVILYMRHQIQGYKKYGEDHPSGSSSGAITKSSFVNEKEDLNSRNDNLPQSGTVVSTKTEPQEETEEEVEEEEGDV